jgi:predicted RNA binding protein YcfA (HicA-like mRNA interferase family)
MSDLVVMVGPVPMKISEIILVLERDGWRLKRVSGSHLDPAAA